MNDEEASMSGDNIEAERIHNQPHSVETLDIPLRQSDTRCDCHVALGYEGKHLVDCPAYAETTQPGRDSEQVELPPVPPGFEPYTPPTAAFPPGYNPAHVANLQHPADVRPSGPAVDLTQPAAGQSEGVKLAKLHVDSEIGTDDDERRRAIGRVAAEDFARTNAKASAEAMEVLTSSAGAIMTNGSSYHTTLLLSLLVRAFISGASFGTQLALERVLAP